MSHAKLTACRWVVPLAVLLCAGAAACNRPSRHDGPRAGGTDSGFATMQARGALVMGVDQYTSQHVFEDLPDGGRIVLDRDTDADTAGVARIRAHMRDIAAAFARGDFAKPFAVHDMTPPGVAEMTARRAAISYEALDRPRGAEVRIRTADSTAVAAVHEFLAFQRREHHAAGHEHQAGGIP